MLDTREQSTNLQTSQRQERVEGIFTELEQKGRMEDTTDWTKILDTLKKDFSSNLMREILVANKGTEGTIEISPVGLARVKFNNTLYNLKNF